MALPIHVAVVQYSTELDTGVGNQDKALHLMDDAAHVADLVLLPEASFVGDWTGHDLRRVAEPVPGPTTAIVSQLAVMRNAFICYSAIEQEGDRFFSTAVLVGGDGRMIGRHRKTRLSPPEQEAGFTPGDEMEVYRTHLGRVGILMCGETQDGDRIRILGGRGAQVVLVPCMATASSLSSVGPTLNVWESGLATAAREGRCHVLWANKTGVRQGSPLIGGSMVLDASGRVVARAGTGNEEIVRSEVAFVPKDLRTELPLPASRE